MFFLRSKRRITDLAESSLCTVKLRCSLQQLVDRRHQWKPPQAQKGPLLPFTSPFAFRATTPSGDSRRSTRLPAYVARIDTI